MLGESETTLNDDRSIYRRSLSHVIVAQTAKLSMQSAALMNYTATSDFKIVMSREYLNDPRFASLCDLLCVFPLCHNLPMKQR